MRKLLLAAAVGYVASAGLGATHTWVGVGGGTYQVAANWSGGVVPLGSDTAIYPAATANASTISLAANTASVNAQFSSSDTKLALNGRTYVVGSLTLSSGGPGIASLTVADGLLSMSSGMRMDEPGTGAAQLTLDNVYGSLRSNFSLGQFSGGGTLALRNGASITLSQVSTLAVGTTAFQSQYNNAIIVESGANLEGGSTVLQRNNGSIFVRSGGRFRVSDFAHFSDTIDSFDVFVDGAGSQFISLFQMPLGHIGRGALTVTDGGRVTLPGPPTSSLDAIMHIGVFGTGTVTVDGADSILDVGSQLNVGRAGDGHLWVSNKAKVISRPSPGNTVFAGAGAIGRDLGGTGTASIDGSGSRWDLLGEFAIARDGTGTLAISNEAIVAAHRATVANRNSGFGVATISSGARLEVRDDFVVGVNESFFGPNAIVTLNPGGTASVGGNTRINESGLLSFLGGRLDLNSSAMLHDYAGQDPTATLTNLVASAYAAGAWTGAGITSSAAQLDSRVGIAIADESAWPLGNFAGEPLDGTGVLLRVTLLGDANADLTVNISDFSLLAANFNQSGNWADGDFNYNGQVNIADFAAMAANFGHTFSPPARGMSIPEPLLAGAALVCFLRRTMRSRRRFT